MKKRATDTKLIHRKISGAAAPNTPEGKEVHPKAHKIQYIEHHNETKNIVGNLTRKK